MHTHNPIAKSRTIVLVQSQTHHKLIKRPPFHANNYLRESAHWPMVPNDLQKLAVFYLLFLAMNAFPHGTRVFFWNAGGEIKYGTVQSTSRLTDGTQVVVVTVDGGEGHSSLPVSSVSKVNYSDFKDVKAALTERTNWTTEVLRNILTIRLANGGYFVTLCSLLLLAMVESIHLHYARLAPLHLKERAENMGYATFAIVIAIPDVGILIVRIVGIVAASGSPWLAFCLILFSVAPSIILPLLIHLTYKHAQQRLDAIPVALDPDMGEAVQSLVRSLLQLTLYDITRSSHDFEDVKAALNERTTWTINVLRTVFVYGLSPSPLSSPMMEATSSRCVRSWSYLWLRACTCTAVVSRRERAENMGHTTFAIVIAIPDIGIIIIPVIGIVEATVSPWLAFSLISIPITLSIILPLLTFRSSSSASGQGLANPLLNKE
ncbi:hypothetical protein BU15DRAFT_82854 [Melanogaster broomeanus]|nr:hypothetical protein BU15DRAFT_82854 [Melanogaster broomeanus]